MGRAILSPGLVLTRPAQKSEPRNCQKNQEDDPPEDEDYFARRPHTAATNRVDTVLRDDHVTPPSAGSAAARACGRVHWGLALNPDYTVRETPQPSNLTRVPEPRPALPDRLAALPGHRATLPDRSAAFLNDSAALPRHPAALPNPSAALPEHWAMRYPDVGGAIFEIFPILSA